MKSLVLATAYAEDSRFCGTDFYECCTVCVCDCHYGLYNVNPQNMVGHCLELLQSVNLTCPVSAASACPVYSRLVAALTYVANIKSFRSLHLQSKFFTYPTQNTPCRKWTETASSGVCFSTNMSKFKYFTLSDQRELVETRPEGV